MPKIVKIRLIVLKLFTEDCRFFSGHCVNRPYSSPADEKLTGTVSLLCQHFVCHTLFLPCVSVDVCTCDILVP